jgi:oxaloacetate decarboxylase gamma subunit
MDITESLYQATALFGLGMAFVFSFLGLLMIAIKLMAKYIPADEPIINRRALNKKVVTTSKSEINPQLIAAITSAVQQYRKVETV